jgi:outer membrane receptor protein involved in Fe transport
MSTDTPDRRLSWLLAALLLIALPSAASAQSGRLGGVITEAATGTPLPGATVMLEGTQLGAASNEDGQYVVVGVTPGTYSVRVSFVGFTPQVTQIRVVSDVLTTLDVALEEASVEGGEVTVTAERPVVDQNQTTSRSLVTGEEMERLPLASLDDAISRTSNAYEGFVRGSRRSETRTIIDGIDVSDALNQATSGIGSGTGTGGNYNSANRSSQTNASLFSLNPEGVEEVTVNTGATEAQYGAATGGVVAVTLADGRGPIRGTASYRIAPSIARPGPDSLDFYVDGQAYLTDRDARIATNNPSARLFTWTPDRYETGEPEMDARFSLGGSVTDRLHFFATGQAFQTHGFQPNEFSRRLNGQLKTTYDFGASTRLSVIGLVEDRGLWGNWNNRSYNEFWRFNLESLAQNDAGSYLGSVRLTQLLSPTSFMEVQAYRTYQRNRFGYVDDDGNGFTDPGEGGEFIDLTDPMNIARYIGTGADHTRMFFENISDGFADTGIALPGGAGRYKAAQPMPYSEDAEQATNGFRVNYNNQVTPNHYVQVGTDLKRYTFDYQQVYGVDQSGAKLNGAREPYQLQEWERSPWNLGLYASDRMEYGGLIVNLGLRVEFVNRDMEVINDYFHPFRRDTVEAGIVYQADAEGNVTPALDAAGNQIPRVLFRNVFDRGEAVPTDVFFNPSIGVSHPIGSDASMYFSFARNSQLQPYSTLYQFYDGNNSNNQFFTYQDPEQRPIVANNYELGGQWEFAPGWGADVNAYMRSIDNYGQATLSATNRNPFGTAPATETVPGLGIHTYATSAGYADSRGIELVLRRAPLRIARDVTLGLTGSYTFSTVEVSNFAPGNTTNFFDPNPRTDSTVTTLPFENTQNFSNFPQAVRGGNSTLTGGYGRTHRFVLRSVAALPYDFSVGLSSSFDSGFLYPRTVDADPRDRELLTGPANYQIDLRLEKRFAFTGRFGLDLFMDVINLTNHRNIVAYNTSTAGLTRTFEETGNPGPTLILGDGTSVYGPARGIYFGSRARF